MFQGGVWKFQSGGCLSNSKAQLLGIGWATKKSSLVTNRDWLQRLLIAIEIFYTWDDFFFCILRHIHLNRFRSSISLIEYKTKLGAPTIRLSFWLNGWCDMVSEHVVTRSNLINLHLEYLVPDKRSLVMHPLDLANGSFKSGSVRFHSFRIYFGFV